MRVVYSLVGSIVTVLTASMLMYSLLQMFYVSTFSNQEKFAPNLTILLGGVLILPVLAILYFIVYYISLGKKNIWGTVIGGALGFWLFSFLNEYISTVPSLIVQIVIQFALLLVIIAGFIFVKHETLKYILLGTILGWLLGYMTVNLGAHNTIVLDFNESLIMRSIVLGVIAVCGIAGWSFSEKLKKRLVRP